MAAPTAPILGFNAKLYRNTGTYGTPIWNEVPNVGDLELSLEASEAATNVRSGAGFEQAVAGLIKAGINFTMIYDPADVDQTAMVTAFFARTSIEFAVMDQAIETAGSQGLRAVCMITKMSRQEKLGEALMFDVTIRPTYSANAPSWMTSV